MTAKAFRSPPFRAEHLGSLLRPDDLLQVREDVDKGQAGEKQLRSIEDGAVRDIVDVQLKLGFHPISDGEYRRHSGCFYWYIGLLPDARDSVLGHLLPGIRGVRGD